MLNLNDLVPPSPQTQRKEKGKKPSPRKFQKQTCFHHLVQCNLHYLHEYYLENPKQLLSNLIINRSRLDDVISVKSITVKGT